jgi:hypothetical protein
MKSSLGHNGMLPTHHRHIELYCSLTSDPWPPCQWCLACRNKRCRTVKYLPGKNTREIPVAIFFAEGEDQVGTKQNDSEDSSEGCGLVGQEPHFLEQDTVHQRLQPFQLHSARSSSQPFNAMTIFSNLGTRELGPKVSLFLVSPLRK